MIEQGPGTEQEPGADGTPLDGDEWVRRVCKEKNKSKFGEIIHEGSFVPTTKEKEEDPLHRISVWAERLTTAEQAYGFTEANAAVDVIVRLNVDEVRRLRPEPDSEGFPHLQVEWHHRFVVDEDGSRAPDPAPGANGHAGIRDLTIGNKPQKRSLRVQLAELARREFEMRASNR